MNIKVSIVIPTFGRPENLLRAISSVMRQTYNNLEIIVVDDNGKGSENQIKTEELLNDEKYKDIIYIVLPNNKGGGIARNYGIEKASGEVITFLDDDDYYLCNKVEVQLRHLIVNNLDISLCDMIIESDGSSRFKHSKRYSNAKRININEFLIDGVAFTPMIMVRKNILLSAGGFLDTPRFQDHTLMLKLFLITDKVGHVESKLFVHCSNMNTRVSNSPKSLKGFLIRHRLENYVMKNQGNIVEQVKFNQCAQVSPFLYKRRGYNKYVSFMIWSLNYNLSVKNVLLTFARVLKISCLAIFKD